jgi:hypothetical protein
MAGELIRYDAMCQAIATAYQVDEVKDIRDRAIALEHYSRLAHNVEAERQCCEIRLRAERKAGQLLAKREKAKGAREPGPIGARRPRTPRGRQRLWPISASLTTKPHSGRSSPTYPRRNSRRRSPHQKNRRQTGSSIVPRRQQSIR